MVFGPMLTLAEFKRRVTEALEEYFSSEDAAELVHTIRELRCPEFAYEVVKRSVSLAMDRKERERELVSRFLSSAYPDLLSTDDVGKGFERLFELMDELELDAPGAADITAAFLARAVNDDVLPPAFLVDPMVVRIGGDVVSKTKRLLCREHQGSRVERIWGPGDGRPVSELKVSINQLLAEFLLSKQLSEAERCVRELGVPHFHWWLVKRAVALAADKDGEEQEAMLHLLVHLHREEVLSTAQVQQGFMNLKETLPDLALDCPRAGEVVEWFHQRAVVDGVLPADGPATKPADVADDPQPSL